MSKPYLQNIDPPKDIFEIVMLLESGPDERGQYSFTLFWLDGSQVQGQCYKADPYTKIHGQRGGTVRIKDLTGNWTGKKVYP